jgi:hypothetical protein
MRIVWALGTRVKIFTLILVLASERADPRQFVFDDFVVGSAIFKEKDYVNALHALQVS